MFEVVVGKDEGAKTSTMHAPLLFEAAEYFQRALKTTFKEGAENRVVPEEEIPEVFGLVNGYIYRSKTSEELLVTVDFTDAWTLSGNLQFSALGTMYGD